MHLSRAFSLFLAVGAAGAIACTEKREVTDASAAQPVDGVPDACLLRNTAPAPAVSDAGLPVAAPASAPLRCVEDLECGAGARCDKALSPPTCVTLYCVPADGACSAAEQCLEGMKCHEGRCNPCNQCGNLCEVDFSSDPKNCGGCKKTISPAQKCINGEATCPGDRPTLCGDECVDTKTDPRHCGACDKPTPNGGACTKGKTSCPDQQTVCAGTCVDMDKDTANCGTCGHVCPTDFQCGGGTCYTSVSSTTAQACTSLCQARSLYCVDAAAIYTSSSQPTKIVDIACSVVPGTAPAGFVFNSVSCACVEP
ncbi:MAG: Tryptophan synthase alpha chain [Labilithrix sp.]|nr:Tryptophan synthase alpha chain [Labilithrix sp.]